jgi:hypothetical protein
MGRIGTPHRFWFFFRKKEQSFPRDLGKVKLSLATASDEEKNDG